jgi:hypothetical protein
MKFFFWKKNTKAKVKPEPRRLAIPEDKVRWIRTLSDVYERAPNGADRAAHYDCWSAIVDIFPEVKYGSWGIEFPNALEAEVVERLDSI